MKKIKSMEREIEVVEDFIHKGVRCIVVSMKWHNKVRAIAPSLHNYHNGYVEIEGKKDYNDYVGEIQSEELTFSGELDMFDVSGYYFGFDTAHYYNKEHPETTTKKAVVKATKKLAEELINKKLAKVQP